MSLTSPQMNQTFWGVVSAAAGSLGTWGVHLRYPFPLARCIWFTIRRPLEKEKKRKNLPRSRSLKLFLRVELQISIFFSTVLITIEPIPSMLLCIIKCLHKFLTGTFLNLDHQNPSLNLIKFPDLLISRL